MNIIDNLLNYLLTKINDNTTKSSPEDKLVIEKEHQHLENAQRLQNVLGTIKHLATSEDYRDKRTIFYIIKVYADKINCKHNSDLLESEWEHFPREDYFLSPFGYLSEMRNIENESTIDFYLGKSPVITRIWNKGRLTRALKNIEVNLFKENSNHNYYIFMPLGLTMVASGNHSINSGIIKTSGHLRFDGTKGMAYDISPLYDKYYFDGTYYREKENDCFVCNSDFEFGCLFEIGRILTEYNMNYFDYFSNATEDNAQIS